MTNQGLNAERTRENTQASVSASRKLVATSHEGKYAYFLAPDLYIYQQNTVTGEWVGWLCHTSAWEFTFSKSAHFALCEVSA